MSILAVLLCVFAQVNLPLTPASQFGGAGSTVTVDLRADAASAQSVAAIDAIVSWNPAELQFLGVVPSSFPWFIAGFLPDPDGINANLQDGSILYTALAPLATPLVVPPGIIVVSFQFKVLTGGNVSLLPSLGTFGKTRVLGITPGVVITGLIGGPACIGIPGSWTNLGLGLAGTGGVPPLLTGSGQQACAAATTLSLTGALPNDVAYLIVGASILGLPFKGGVLVPQLNVVIMLPTSPTGTLLIVTPWPAGIPNGFSIYYQCWMKDPGGVLGWASSNGLRSTTG